MCMLSEYILWTVIEIISLKTFSKQIMVKTNNKQYNIRKTK